MIKQINKIMFEEQPLAYPSLLKISKTKKMPQSFFEGLPIPCGQEGGLGRRAEKGGILGPGGGLAAKGAQHVVPQGPGKDVFYRVRYSCTGFRLLSKLRVTIFVSIMLAPFYNLFFFKMCLIFIM